MKPQWAITLSLFLCGAAWTSGQEETPLLSASDQLAAINQEYNDAMQKFYAAYQEAGEDEAKLTQVFETSFPKPDDYTPRYLNLAEAFPGSDEAREALTWVANEDPDDAHQASALNMFEHQFGLDECLGDICWNFAYSDSPTVENFLKRVSTQSPHARPKGIATYILGVALLNQSRTAQRIAADPATKERYLELRGAEYIAQLRTEEELISEAREKLETVISDYAEVTDPRGHTIGQRASSELFELDNLVVGKEAPEIIGTDVDGVEFKLSDYRGKVVFLDFWGHW